VQPLAGKPVLHASNYIPQRDGRIPGLYDGPPSSEVLQRHLPTAHVVRVFNNIITGISARWRARPARPTVAPCLSPGTTRPRRQP